MELAGQVIAQFLEMRVSVIETVTEALETVLEHTGEDRGGGCFCLLHHLTNKMVIEPTMVGEIRNGKRDEYQAFCREKAVRLSMAYDLLYFSDNQKNRGSSSWGTRNEEKQRWGGAILVALEEEQSSYREPLVLSFAGLSELSDEAVVLLAAIKLEFVTKKKAIEIASISDNSTFLDVIGVE